MRSTDEIQWAWDMMLTIFTTSTIHSNLHFLPLIIGYSVSTPNFFLERRRNILHLAPPWFPSDISISCTPRGRCPHAFRIERRPRCATIMVTNIITATYVFDRGWTLDLVTTFPISWQYSPYHGFPLNKFVDDDCLSLFSFRSFSAPVLNFCFPFALIYPSPFSRLAFAFD